MISANGGLYERSYPQNPDSGETSDSVIDDPVYITLPGVPGSLASDTQLIAASSNQPGFGVMEVVNNEQVSWQWISIEGVEDSWNAKLAGNFYQT